jgi:hypothetical protein
MGIGLPAIVTVCKFPNVQRNNGAGWEFTSLFKRLPGRLVHRPCDRLPGRLNAA